MVSSGRRVVITGIGLVTPLGCSPDLFWDRLASKSSAVARLRSFAPDELPSQIGAELIDFNARDFIDKKERKRLNQMVRTMHLAVAAAELAVRDGALTAGVVDPTRLSVVFGSSTVPGDLGDLGEAAIVSTRDDPPGVDLKRWGEAGIPNVPPMWMLTHIPNMTASHVAILHNAQGPTNTVSLSDVGGMLALGEAYRLLQARRADAVLVGGADTKVAPINLIRYCLAGKLSRRNAEPARASRPFDRDRDGQVFGEGAAVLLMEDRDTARARGAKIYGEVIGFASGIDPDLKGSDLARIIRLALDEAAAKPIDIDHVNAHGASDRVLDAWEAAGIAEAFRDVHSGVSVTAPKSFFGNLGTGGGLVELAASLLGAQKGLVPATLNYETPDPSCPVAVLREARASQGPTFVKIGCTDMGQVGVAVLRAGEGN